VSETKTKPPRKKLITAEDHIMDTIRCISEGAYTKIILADSIVSHTKLFAAIIFAVGFLLGAWSHDWFKFQPSEEFWRSSVSLLIALGFFLAVGMFFSWVRKSGKKKDEEDKKNYTLNINITQ